jgi:hypothetical protein
VGYWAVQPGIAEAPQMQINCDFDADFASRPVLDSTLTPLADLMDADWIKDQSCHRLTRSNKKSGEEQNYVDVVDRAMQKLNLSVAVLKRTAQLLPTSNEFRFETTESHPNRVKVFRLSLPEDSFEFDHVPILQLGYDENNCVNFSFETFGITKRG